MALEKRKESSINMFLTFEDDFPLDQGLVDKMTSELDQALPEALNNSHVSTFHRNISDLEAITGKGLPPLSIIDDDIKYSSLPTPVTGSKYEADVYWSSADPYAGRLNDASDPNLYFHEDSRLYGGLESSYRSPISPHIHKKQKSIDITVSESILKSTLIPAIRKKTIINPCTCSGTCGIQIATIYMRGPIPELEKSYVIDVLCNTCSDTKRIDVSFAEGQYIPTSRKRSRDIQKLVECDVCRKQIGLGGIRSIHSVEQISPDLTVEFVCNSCISKYQFCSECGGGGKSRTGKWRPIELFEKGRRTCALPHVRVGDSPFRTVSYSQAELTGAILNQIQDVFFDSYLSYYAGPSFMEMNNQTFTTLVEETIYPLWEKGVFRYISSPPPKNVSRYIVIEWMQKQHRNKAKAKAHKEEGGSRWLKIIADKTSMMQLNLESVGDSLGDHTCVSFGIVEWDHEKRVIFIPQILPRSFFTKSLQAYDQVINHTINSIHVEAFRDRISVPLYVVLFGKSDNLKVRGIPERLGFFTKSEFIAGEPSSKKILNGLHHPIMETPKASIHVASMSQLVAKLDKN